MPAHGITPTVAKSQRSLLCLDRFCPYSSVSWFSGTQCLWFWEELSDARLQVAFCLRKVRGQISNLRDSCHQAISRSVMTEGGLMGAAGRTTARSGRYRETARSCAPLRGRDQGASQVSCHALQEAQSARENLRGLRETILVAQEVGTGPGRSEVLQRKVPSPGSQYSQARFWPDCRIALIHEGEQFVLTKQTK